jgi:phage shock protein PspC (stress-responsive transcriptional regulator)
MVGEPSDRHASTMESHDDDPTTPQPAADPSEQPTTSQPPEPRRLYRSRDERIVGGVCGGLAEYFAIDPLIVRIIAVALVFAGGAGFLAYLAAWLLVPEADADPADRGTVGRTKVIAGTFLLVIAVGALLPFSGGGPFGGWSWSGPLVSLVCLGLAGLAIWWVASGDHPTASNAREILRRAGFGLAILAVCGLLAIGGAWATAAGGGTLVAVVVIVAGLWLVAGAFLGGARWLILPALALALPAGVVSAAGVDINGGVGDRTYRPVAAGEVRDNYRLGVGEMVIDLRNADLPPGDHRMHVEIGAGAATIVVPRNVCVTSAAHVGAGQVNVFDHGSGGLDVDWKDDRTAPAGTTRLVVDGDVGVGVIDVGYTDPNANGFHEHRFNIDRAPGNTACIGGARG